MIKIEFLQFEHSRACVLAMLLHTFRTGDAGDKTYIKYVSLSGFASGSQ